MSKEYSDGETITYTDKQWFGVSTSQTGEKRLIIGRGVADLASALQNSSIEGSGGALKDPGDTMTVMTDTGKVEITINPDRSQSYRIIR